MVSIILTIRSRLHLDIAMGFMLVLLFMPSLLAISNSVNAFKSDIVQGWPPVHQEITADGLSFLKTDVVNDIAENVAAPDSSTDLLNNNFHFDNCNFQGTTEKINELYDTLVADLNPASPSLSDAAAKFGLIMHPIQDFYAHSNWVELNNANLAHGLVDNGLGKWTVLRPYSMIGNVIIVQGTVPPIGFDLTRNDRIVTVTTDLDKFPGLISGTFTEFGATSFCPDSIAMSHDDLNKDDSSRPFFQDARNMATDQTRHEWCRLVNLVDQSYGMDGVNFLFDNWVADRNIAMSACSQ